MDGQFGRPAGRRGKTAAAVFAALAGMAVMSAPAGAAITITPTDDAELIARAILDTPDTTYVNSEFTTRPVEFVPAPNPEDPDIEQPVKTGAVIAPDLGTAFSGFPLSGADFGLLSTGDPLLLENDPALPDTPEQNDYEDSGKSLIDSENLATERGLSVHDATTLRIDVLVPDQANCLALNYRFLSDEFPEFVGSQFNDAFMAELDTTTWRADDTSNDIIAPNDFATKVGVPVSVNGVGPTAVSNAEAAATTFDAATGLVTSKTPVTPGSHSLYLSVFDQGDHIYDSVVMLDRLGFINESPATCKPPEVPVIPPPPPPPPPPAQGPPVPPPPVNDITVPGGSVNFGNGGFTLAVTVPGPGVMVVNQAPAANASRATAAATKKLVKRATKIVTQAGKVKVKMKLTKRGLRVLRKKGKLKVRLAVRFTPTGGTANTEFTTVKIKKRR